MTANVNKKNNNGDTSCSLSEKIGHQEIMEILRNAHKVNPKANLKSTTKRTQIK